MMPAEWVDTLGQNASQALLLLAVAGVIASALRYRQAVRPDLLLAFMVFLAGSAVREIPPAMIGMNNWTAEWIELSVMARFVKIAGVLLFIRGSLRDNCGPWGWRIVAASVLAIVLVV